jgi:hypothetical protein
MGTRSFGADPLYPERFEDPTGRLPSTERPNIAIRILTNTILKFVNGAIIYYSQVTYARNKHTRHSGSFRRNTCF